MSMKKTMNRQRLILPKRWERFSLSPGERAGVRASVKPFSSKIFHQFCARHLELRFMGGRALFKLTSLLGFMGSRDLQNWMHFGAMNLNCPRMVVAQTAYLLGRPSFGSPTGSRQVHIWQTLGRITPGVRRFCPFGFMASGKRAQRFGKIAHLSISLTCRAEAQRRRVTYHVSRITHHVSRITPNERRP